MPKRDVAPRGAPCWVDLVSSDAEASRAFYGELFGWTSDQAGEEYGGYITFSKDGIPVAGLMQHVQEYMGDRKDIWSISLAVDDADATTAAAAANGGSVAMPVMDIPEIGRSSMVLDAGGAAIGVWQPTPFEGFGIWGEPDTPGWFELHTRDYDPSLQFYRDVFGWETHVGVDEPDFRYTTLGQGDDALAGVMDASGFLPEGVPAHWSVYFQVDDADAALAKIGELGGATVMPAEDTPYGRLATATDATASVFKLLAR